jgi:replicative DNA helicase
MQVLIEAERSVLGGILLDPKAYDEAAARGLNASAFSLDSHRHILSRDAANGRGRIPHRPGDAL